jgi:hypothetical protein
MKTDRTIRSCGGRRLAMDVVCPQRWSDLAPTGVEGERHCAQCRKRVYFCATDAETLAHAREGHCIAREVPDESTLPTRWMVLGRPARPPPEPSEEEERGWKWVRRESGIAEALASANPSSRECPECSYPVPRWRKSCYVCGHELGRGV